MKYGNKKAIVKILKNYNDKRDRAKKLMKKGDINAYVHELIEMENRKKQLQKNMMGQA